MKRAERNQVKLLAHSLRACVATVDERVATFSAAKYIRGDLAEPLLTIGAIALELEQLAREEAPV